MRRTLGNARSRRDLADKALRLLVLSLLVGLTIGPFLWLLSTSLALFRRRLLAAVILMSRLVPPLCSMVSSVVLCQGCHHWPFWSVLRRVLIEFRLLLLLLCPVSGIGGGGAGPC